LLGGAAKFGRGRVRGMGDAVVTRRPVHPEPVGIAVTARSDAGSGQAAAATLHSGRVVVAQSHPDVTVRVAHRAGSNRLATNLRSGVRLRRLGGSEVRAQLLVRPLPVELPPLVILAGGLAVAARAFGTGRVFGAVPLRFGRGDQRLEPRLPSDDRRGALGALGDVESVMAWMEFWGWVVHRVRQVRFPCYVTTRRKGFNMTVWVTQLCHPARCHSRVTPRQIVTPFGARTVTPLCTVCRG